MPPTRSKGICANSARMGLLDKLRGLKGRHPPIGDVRGIGLMIGVENDRRLLFGDKRTLPMAPDFAQIPSDRVGGNASPLPLQGVLAHGLTESLLVGF